MPTEIVVPPLSQTMDTVVLVEWLKAPGEQVVKGEPLFVVETDKANLEVEAPASGTLGRITARPGTEVKVKSVIGVVFAEGEAAEASAAAHAAPEPAVREAHAEARPSYSGPDGRPLRPDRQARIFASPRARRLAGEGGVELSAVRATGPQGMIVEQDVRAAMLGAVQQGAPEIASGWPAQPGITPVAKRLAEEADLDWRGLSGTGPRGQITRDDVEQALAKFPKLQATTPELAGPVRVEGLPGGAAPEEPLEIIPLAGVRAVIAERMALSHSQTAPVTLTTEADATALVQLRQQLAQDGVEVSYNDLLLSVLARALREHPRLNASLDLDGNSIKVWRRIDIGLAVDAERGLLVPVVRDVDRKGLAQLAAETKALTERARASRCTPEELRGSTFTLTNLGMYGIDAFTPIINLPECAILGVGRIKEQPAVFEGEVSIRQRVWLSLTFDHRLVDGGPAARFLQRVVQLVERPHLLMA